MRPCQDNKDDRASRLAAWQREVADMTLEEAALELKRLREEQAQLITQYPSARIQLFWLEYGPLVLVLSILVVAAILIATVLLR